ncbi:hypothetical protein [Mycobacterium sp.]|uniref:hypothetical protein n=1 Tax=Mycobacterium sp. TaxID=1785 RepID=UPI0025F784F0|nr:hypothetical protein [Mycobacterium sp.]
MLLAQSDTTPPSIPRSKALSNIPGVDSAAPLGTLISGGRGSAQRWARYAIQGSPK